MPLDDATGLQAFDYGYLRIGNEVLLLDGPIATVFPIIPALSVEFRARTMRPPFYPQTRVPVRPRCRSRSRDLGRWTEPDALGTHRDAGVYFTSYGAFSLDGFQQRLRVVECRCEEPARPSRFSTRLST